jgi:hypothetical protein
MYLSINKKPIYNDEYKEYLILITKHRNFQIRWFTEYGNWFFYIHIGSNWWRFSNMGYLSSRICAGK